MTTMIGCDLVGCRLWLSQFKRADADVREMAVSASDGSIDLNQEGRGTHR